MARIFSDTDFVFNAIAIEDELNGASMSFAVPEAEITSFTDAAGNFMPGKPGITLSMDGSADFAASQGDATIFAALGTTVTYDYEPAGTTGYNGYGFTTSYTITSNVREAVKYSHAMRHNGGAAANDGALPTRA